MSKKPLAVLLANLGTPSDPTPQAVREFLRPFLSDRRVVEVPRPIWWLILNGFILPFRPKPVAEGYQSLWDEYGDSPLRIFTQSQVKKLQVALGQEVLVDYVFSYSETPLADKIEHYRTLAERIVILPLYPQYSCSTTAAVYDQLGHYQKNQRDVADVYIIKHYYQQASYRKALADSVRNYWQAKGRSEFLLMSFHGVPEAYAKKGDPYYQQCLQTAENLAQDLGLDAGSWQASFQSRLGKAPWLQPYTDVTVKALAKKGIKTIDVVCPSFSVDCLETLEEITIENGEYFTEAGGEKLHLIPCLNDSDAHITMMAELLTPFKALP